MTDIKTAMSNVNLTRWFDGAIEKPVRRGVYMQISGGVLKKEGYQYWDGKQWGSWEETIDSANRVWRNSKAHPSCQDDKWRGKTK